MKLWDSPGKMLLRLSVVLMALLAFHPMARKAATAKFLPKTGQVATALLPVYSQDGIKPLTERVMASLPGALEQLRIHQGATPDKPYKIYVYNNIRDFSSQGACPPEARACAFWGDIYLSPKLLDELTTVQHILTHELSHLVLQQRMGAFTQSRMPAWFSEGLAVVVSDGGGAEGIGQDEALRTLKTGPHFEPEMSHSWLNQTTAVNYNMPHRLFYRQAALFVQFLKNQHPNAFDELLRRMHSGMGFHTAFERSFPQGMPQQWQAFLKSL